MSCPQCSGKLEEINDLLICSECGLRARKTGFILNWGRKFRRNIQCPQCGTIATEDQFKEV